MLRNGFQSILEFSHFNDNSQHDVNNPNRDTIFKVRPVVTYLETKFKTVYSPDREVSIDEEPILWKGRLVLSNIFPTYSRFKIKICTTRLVSIYGTPLFI